MSVTDQFYNLTPEKALSSIEKQGFCLTGRFTQLNSYENRVFSLELDTEMTENTPDIAKGPSDIIAKFYRPNRWSKEAVREEHQFLFELLDSGLPVVAPLKLHNSEETVFSMDNIHATIFPKAKGRIPQDLNIDEFKSIGRLLARLHNVGAKSEAQHRPKLDAHSYGDASLGLLEQIIAPEIKPRYLEVADEILYILEELLLTEPFIRIHGDCHKGNLLQTDPLTGPKEFFFVDFDDFCNGPVAYDFWMILLGQTKVESDAFISGYSEFRNFDAKSLELMEPLRALRMIYYSAWIARRWSDPNFKILFPNFNSYNYWAEELGELEKILNTIS